LNSPLKFSIWIEMPKGFTNEDGMTHAKLNKSLYGLKQAGRDWYQCQDDFILAYDKRFQRSAVEPCLYFIVSKEITILILVHVDDYVIASNSPAHRDSYLDAFEAKYPCERLGKLSTILQMGVTWASNSVSLSQERQIKEPVAQYGEADSNPILSPMNYLCPQWIITGIQFTFRRSKVNRCGTGVHQFCRTCNDRFDLGSKGCCAGDFFYGAGGRIL
jgi:hypothetical protein